MKALIILGLLLNASYAKIIEIYDTKSKNTISIEQLLKSIDPLDIHVLGEFHNTSEIQNSQAEIIKHISDFFNYKENFTVHWEFLNHQDQADINNDLKRLYLHEIKPIDLINKFAGKQNNHYEKIVSLVGKYKAHLSAVNIPRKIKQKVIREGISSIDQNLIPNHHYVGGPSYLDRFKIAMGGHVSNEVLLKYFEVQCLTDSIMADEVTKKLNPFGNFVIAGSFHTDFYDATVERLNRLINKKITTYKFVSINTSSNEEITSYKAGDEKFGQYADYIIITQ